MSPMLTSQVVALATAAAMAVSGTVILVVLRLHQKTLPGKSPFRLCITSSSSSSSSSSGAEEVHDGGTRSMGEKQISNITNRRKKNKGVRFADGVADPAGYNKTKNNNSRSRPNSSPSTTTTSADKINRGMPENRMALYNGILRDRLIHRIAYSY